MTLYSGPAYTDGEASLRYANPSDVLGASKSNDWNEDSERWCRRAPSDDSIVYFGLFFHGKLLGQIFLHDWDRLTNESLVGYHIFEESWRGHGIGTKALRLLQKYVLQETEMFDW
jgi:RimJ/RimL family protein N-acetyltransferase